MMMETTSVTERQRRLMDISGLQARGLQTVCGALLRRPVGSIPIHPRQIRGLRRQDDCSMLILGRRHLETGKDEWIGSHNETGPHRGLDLRTLIARSDLVDATAAVRCCTRLGGLIREYSSQTALQAA